jgi:hypothetical protein
MQPCYSARLPHHLLSVDLLVHFGRTDFSPIENLLGNTDHSADIIGKGFLGNSINKLIGELETFRSCLIPHLHHLNYFVSTEFLGDLGIVSAIKGHASYFVE